MGLMKGTQPKRFFFKKAYLYHSVRELFIDAALGWDPFHNKDSKNSFIPTSYLPGMQLVSGLLLRRYYFHCKSTCVSVSEIKTLKRGKMKRFAFIVSLFFPTLTATMFTAFLSYSFEVSLCKFYLLI